MKIQHVWRYLFAAFSISLMLSLFSLAGCTTGQGPYYFDGGAGNVTLTGSQFAKYNFFRLDTTAGDRALTLPSASDLASAIAPTAIGNFIVFIVAADGANAVKIYGGANVTVKPSAAVIQANSTSTLYCVFNAINASNAAVTIY